MGSGRWKRVDETHDASLELGSMASADDPGRAKAPEEMLSKGLCDEEANIRNRNGVVKACSASLFREELV